MALIDDALTALSDLEASFEDVGPIGCHVFLFGQRGRDRHERWQRVSMNAALSERFTEAVRNASTESRARAVEEDGLLEFDFDTMATGSVGVLALADAPELAAWLDELPEPDWPAIFQGDPDFVEKTRFYGIDVRFASGRRLRSFRGKSGLRIVLERGSRVAAMFRQDSDEMQPVQGAVLTFDDRTDFFEWDGFVFIMNLSAFEAVTNIRAITAAKAHAAIDVIAARFGVPDVEGLKGHLSGRAKLAKKLAAAARHGLLDDVDGERLIARVEKRGFAVHCRKEDGRYTFDLDLSDRAGVEEFVNLMTDVYLHSPVTNREWKVTSKRPA